MKRRKTIVALCMMAFMLIGTIFAGTNVVKIVSANEENEAQNGTVIVKEVMTALEADQQSFKFDYTAYYYDENGQKVSQQFTLGHGQTKELVYPVGTKLYIAYRSESGVTWYIEGHDGFDTKEQTHYLTVRENTRTITFNSRYSYNSTVTKILKKDQGELPENYVLQYLDGRYWYNLTLKAQTDKAGNKTGVYSTSKRFTHGSTFAIREAVSDGDTANTSYVIKDCTGAIVASSDSLEAQGGYKATDTVTANGAMEIIISNDTYQRASVSVKLDMTAPDEAASKASLEFDVYYMEGETQVPLKSFTAGGSKGQSDITFSAPVGKTIYIESAKAAYWTSECKSVIGGCDVKTEESDSARIFSFTVGENGNQVSITNTKMHTVTVVSKTIAAEADADQTYEYKYTEYYYIGGEKSIIKEDSFVLSNAEGGKLTYELDVPEGAYVDITQTDDLDDSWKTTPSIDSGYSNMTGWSEDIKLCSIFTRGDVSELSFRNQKSYLVTVYMKADNCSRREFSLTYSADGGVEDIEMKDGDSLEVNIQYGSGFEIEQEDYSNEDVTTTFKIGDGKTEYALRSYFTVTEDTDIIIENTDSEDPAQDETDGKDDGKDSGNKTPAKPNTGDDSLAGLYMLLISIASSGICAVIVIRRMRHEER